MHIYRKFDILLDKIYFSASKVSIKRKNKVHSTLQSYHWINLEQQIWILLEKAKTKRNAYVQKPHETA